MEIAVKSVSCECRNNLDFRIAILVGYVAVGVVVLSYLHRRTESEAVKIPTHSALNGNKCGLAVGRNPILTDFQKGGRCLEPFSHFHYYKEHSEYLISATSGYHIEI